MLPEPNFLVSPQEFVGRKAHVDECTEALRYSTLTGRMASFAVLGDWGIGKSSLLFKLAASCADSNFRMLPVTLSLSNDISDYMRFAEALCDRLAHALLASDSLATRFRAEIENWKLSRISLGALTIDRHSQRYFLSSGSALLRHALGEAWDRFIRPAYAGAIFFLDDLHNLATPTVQDTALIVRDQFQFFGVEGINLSVCFSAKPDYFSGSIASPSLPFASTASSFWHRSHLMKRSNTPKRCLRRKRMFNLLHSGSTRRHSAIRISSRSSAVNCSPVGTTLPRSFGPKFLPS